MATSAAVHDALDRRLAGRLDGGQPDAPGRGLGRSSRSRLERGWRPERDVPLASEVERSALTAVEREATRLGRRPACGASIQLPPAPPSHLAAWTCGPQPGGRGGGGAAGSARSFALDYDATLDAGTRRPRGSTDRDQIAVPTGLWPRCERLGTPVEPGPTWVAFPRVLPHHAWYGRKGVVLAETARDPRGDWLLSRPSRAGAASPRPFAGKPAESNQLTDLAGSGWSTGRRLDRG